MRRNKVRSWDVLLAEAIGEDAALRVIFSHGKHQPFVMDNVKKPRKSGLLRTFLGGGATLP